MNPNTVMLLLIVVVLTVAVWLVSSLEPVSNAESEN